VELVMVIAILSIITTLAVQRFGNMQAIAARKVSIASQQAVGRAVESFLSVNRGTGLNRLDALVGYGVTGGAHGFRYGDAATLGLYCGPHRPRVPGRGDGRPEEPGAFPTDSATCCARTRSTPRKAVRCATSDSST
jgi:type II secretory pathway pseudopilin PulG